MDQRHPAAMHGSADAPAARRLCIPWILWRHLGWDVLRMFLVTTGVIVTVIAFGAAAKPLADNSIGADTVLKYVGLAMVPMLQFAMPFAAGFAATLVLHRFATDNEILAMAASGMGYRRILAPVAALGALLAVAMLVLVMFTVPRFWARMQQLATADATQLLLGAVARGEALAADRLMIYADAAREVEPPAGSGIRRRLLLSGVAAIELDRPASGTVATEFTAEDAAVDIHDTPRGMVAKVALMNATVVRPAEGAIVTVPLAEPEAAAVYGDLRRGPKMLTLPEILELRADVDRSQDVGNVKRDVAAGLGEMELWRCVERGIAQPRLELLEPGTDRGVSIADVAVAAGQLRPAKGKQEFLLTETLAGRPVRTARARAGALRAVSEAGYQPRFSLQVTGATNVRDLASGLPGRWPPTLDDLLPAGCAPRDWSAAGSLEVLEASADLPSANGVGPYASIAGRIRKQRAYLDYLRKDVVWESDSHVANRFAQSASIALILLLGAALAVALRQAMPLTVYVLAFIPAVANIFMVSGGQLLMSDGGTVSGSILMWGGNAVLLAALVLAWRKLARN